jgi:hypothetical protein
MLVAINDSRCKPDVQCIWAGELAAELLLKTSPTDEGKKLRLGQITKACDQGVHLIAITKTTATFSKSSACVTE